MVDAVVIISSLLAIIAALYAFIKGLKDVNCKALFIVLFIFSIPTLWVMTKMPLRWEYKLEFTHIIFVISSISLFAIALWMPVIIIEHLKNTSESKEINILLAIILYAVLFLISYTGIFGISYLFNKVM